MNYLIKWLKLIAILILLTIFGSFFFQYVYYYIQDFQRGVDLFGSDETWALFFGGIYSFFFFLPLLLAILFKKNKYYLIIIPIVLSLPLIWLYWRDSIYNITLIGLMIAGWLIGEGINYFRKKSVK